MSDDYEQGKENGQRDTWIGTLQADVAEIKADLKVLTGKVYWAYGAATALGAVAGLVVSLLTG